MRTAIGMLLTCLAGSVFFSICHAQDGKDKAFPVAIVNVDKIFKAFKPLQDKLAPLKSDVQEFEKNVQLKQVELETTQQKLVRTSPESPDFAKLQGQFGKLRGELQTFIEKERRGFQKREAKAHVEVYQVMEDEVKKICKERGIKLAIRQSDGDLKDEKVEEVLKALNRGIIYSDDLDITDAVLKAMEAKGKAN